jgi:hypothetical protein
MEKVHITSSNYSGWTTSPINYKTEFPIPELSKTGQITPQTVLDGGFTIVTVVLSFLFIYLR